MSKLDHPSLRRPGHSVLHRWIWGLAVAVPMWSADTVNVVATTPQANEQGQVTGYFTFTRTGTGQPLVVNYTLSGSAVSDDSTVTAGQRGHIGSFRANGSVPFDVVGGGSSNSYYNSRIQLSFDNSAQSNVKLQGGVGTAAGYASSVGGHVTAFVQGVAGKGYTKVPTMVVVDAAQGGRLDIGRGAFGTPVLSNYIASVVVTDGGLYRGNRPPQVVASGGSGFTGTAVMKSLGYVILEGVSDGGLYPSTSTPKVTIAAPQTPGGTQATTSVTFDGTSGKITAVTLTERGKLYTFADAPTVTVDPPYANVNGAPANASLGAVTIAGGGVTGVPVAVAGQWYVNPVVTFSGGGGSGATAHAVINPADGSITSIQVDSAGSNYTSVPTAKISAADGKRAVVTVWIAATVDYVDVTAGGKNYTAPMTITFTDNAAKSQINAAAGFGTSAIDKIDIPNVGGVSLRGRGYEPTATVIINEPDAGDKLNAHEWQQAAFTPTISPSSISSLSLDVPGFNYDLPTVTIADPYANPTAAVTQSVVIAGTVDHVAVTSGGSGYSVPTVDFPTTDPVAVVGTGAKAILTTSGGVLTAVSVANGGTGWAVPWTGSDFTVKNPTGAPAPTVVGTVRPVTAGQVTQIDPVTGGSGYSSTNPPLVIISDPTGNGSGATARAVVTNGVVTKITLLTPGSGYQSVPTIVLRGGQGSGATAKATLGKGQIISLAIQTAGSGYVTPAVTISGPAAGGVTALASATVRDIGDGTGTIISIDVNNHGSGYQAPTVTAVDQDSNGVPRVSAILQPVVAGPDFTAPLNTMRQNDGTLSGSVVFAANQTAVTIPIKPYCNGMPGSRLVVAGIVPSTNGSYIVGNQASDVVTIADMDGSLTVKAAIGTAYSIPTHVDSTAYALPIEVQGRGEWVWSLDDTFKNGYDILYQTEVRFLVGRGDTTVSPLTAAIGTDYTFLHGHPTVGGNGEGVLAESAFVVPLTPSSGAPTAGDTDLGVANAIFGTNAAVCLIDQASNVDIYKGVYRITARFTNNIIVNNTGYPTNGITVTPALRTGAATVLPMTQYYQTRVKSLGLWSGITAPTQLQYFQVTKGTNYMTALPAAYNGAPRGSMAANIAIVQTPDYKSLSPTNASIVFADTSALIGIQLVGNASQPSVSGSVRVTASAAFTRDVYVPFRLTSAVNGPVLGLDYSVVGADLVSGRGKILLPAGSTSVDIQLTPLGSTLVVPGAVTVSLDASDDYRIVPASNGSSALNPSVDVTVNPATKTVGGDPLLLGVEQTPTAGVEGRVGSDVIFKISLMDSTGKLSTDKVASDTTFVFALGGNAVAGVNYVAPTLSATIPSGGNSVTIRLPVIDDGRVNAVPLSVSLSLVPGVGYDIVGSSSSAVAGINDGSPVISIVRVGDVLNGQSTAVFKITADVPSKVPLTIGLGTTGSTGTVGQDYNAPPASVSLPIGQTQAMILIDATGMVYTSGKLLQLSVLDDTANPPRYRVSSASGTATANVVPAPDQLSMGVASAMVDESSTAIVTIPVVLKRTNSDFAAISALLKASATSSAMPDLHYNAWQLSSGVAVADATQVFDSTGYSVSFASPLTVSDDAAIGSTQISLTLSGVSGSVTLSSSTVLLIAGGSYNVKSTVSSNIVGGVSRTFVVPLAVATTSLISKGAAVTFGGSQLPKSDLTQQDVSFGIKPKDNLATDGNHDLSIVLTSSKVVQAGASLERLTISQKSVPQFSLNSVYHALIPTGTPGNYTLTLSSDIPLPKDFALAARAVPATAAATAIKAGFTTGASEYSFATLSATWSANTKSYSIPFTVSTSAVSGHGLVVTVVLEDPQKEFPVVQLQSTILFTSAIAAADAGMGGPTTTNTTPTNTTPGQSTEVGQGTDVSVPAAKVQVSEGSGSGGGGCGLGSGLAILGIALGAGSLRRASRRKVGC